MTLQKLLSFPGAAIPLAMSAVLPALLFTAAANAADARPEPVTLTGGCVSLAGQWRFALDGDRKGVDEKWFTRHLDDSVKLPGTTDENHKGIFKDDHRTDRLSRLWYWKGPAWYQRDVIVPAAWKGKHITLLLERTKHTSVWVDDQPCGMRDSLSAPQVFDLSKALTPGRHTISLLVDNSILPPVRDPHAFNEDTQTNWNGVIGRIELRATGPVWMDDVQVYPDVKTRTVRVKAVVGNATGAPVEGELTVNASTGNAGKVRALKFRDMRFPVRVADANGTVEATYKLGENAPLWDEFNPTMIRLKLDLAAQPASVKDAAWEDTRIVHFGLRKFSTFRNQFIINGRPTFLRGKHDACVFPLTGYPPMDKAGWLRVLGIAKSYSINHYRFHSWCPPEAAFEAADELGMYLQPELPNKATSFNKAASRDYLTREGERIFKAFGNHPSFVMFTLGNELGRQKEMFDIVRHFRAVDPRHLHAQGSNNCFWRPELNAGDDFWVTFMTGKDLPARGSFFQGDYNNGPIENSPPSTMTDFSESIAGVPVPVVGHEVGQFQVFPDFGEIPKYTGVLRARNFETFRQRLADANMLDQADDFVRASGALAVICYREDIEEALRTPGFGGLQLLDLQDYPGQGTALVGILNAFMESKGLITPAHWRQFCCPVVPLLRMTKYTWTTDEKFTGRAQVANYGPDDLAGAEIGWTVTDAAGRRVAGGELGPKDIKQGNVREAGMFCFPLAKVAAPCKLTITLAIKGTPRVNRYPIWVYPPKADTSAPKGVTVTRTLDADAWDRLGRGERVVLLPKLETLDDPDKSIAGSFQCDFWCWPMFKGIAERKKVPVAPGTLGILCDPNAPALADFPTSFHSDWQWWQLVKHARPIVLDATPADYRPTVQVIDNFVRNHKLGLIFETKAGKGKLLVCAIDLPGLADKPEARQMLASLLKYAGSKKFAPKGEVDAALLKKLFSPK